MELCRYTTLYGAIEKTARDLVLTRNRSVDSRKWYYLDRTQSNDYTFTNLAHMNSVQSIAMPYQPIRKPFDFTTAVQALHAVFGLV